MTLDDVPMSSVGKKVLVQDKNSRQEGYLLCFEASSDVIQTIREDSPLPVATYFGPTHYNFTLLVGATQVHYDTSDPNIQIDLVKE